MKESARKTTGRRVKSITHLAIVGVFAGLCVTGVTAAVWTDNFESYTANDPLPSPWLDNTGSALVITGTGGFGGSQAVALSGSLGVANRPADGGTILFGKLYAPSGSGARATIGFTTGTNIGRGDPGGTDEADIVLRELGGSADLLFMTMDYTAGVPGTEQDMFSGTLSVDTWYDVRMEVNGLDVTTMYKPASATSWTTIGTLIAPSGFSPNLVGLRLENSGRIDELNLLGVPEPSVLSLLLLSLAGIGWCRAGRYGARP